MLNTKFISIVLGLALVAGAIGAVSPIRTADASQSVDVLIAFGRTPGPNERAVVHGFGGAVRHSFHLVPAVAARVPEASLAALSRHPLVTLVEFDGEVRAIGHAEELNNTWGVQRIGAGDAHHGGFLGGGVNVAVIDSGIDHTHAELASAHAGGYDFVNGDTDPMDDNGHGTHVAGTVAAALNGAGVVGVSPGVALYSLKVLNSSGSGSWSDIIAALEWAVDNGIRVTNNSYGSGSDPGSLVQAAFDNSYAAGVLHIAAAGNSGNPPGNGDNVGYPARYASVVAVAATDQNDQRPRWSSTGPDVELAAPGVSINSTLLGGGYGTLSGTSMASPHVAGTAALVMAAGTTNNGDVRQILRDTANDLGNPNHYGYGLVNALAAVGGSAPPTATGTISGTVVDAVTLGALAGAVVTDGTRSATTDASGAYALTDVPEGTYTVTASASGYESASQADVAVTADTTTTVNFALQPSAGGAEGNMTVNAITYSKHGGKNNDRHLTTAVSVVDANGSAVGGASVSIVLTNTSSGGSWTGTATTGGDGTASFTLNNAPTGCYETEVTNVSASGLVWDGVTPPNGTC